MNAYAWRKNFTALFQEEQKTIRGKLAFKTKETDWLGTENPVVALVSIHSRFHKFIDGDLKMNAFISTIKSCTRSRVTVLLSDRAHLQVTSLKYRNNAKAAFADCLLSAHRLKDRYQSYFDSCNVVYWHSYIFQDKSFLPALKIIEELLCTDPIFQNYLLRDAESSYSIECAQEFPNKAQFIAKTVEDIVEQCACLLVLSGKGYRFQFYPGPSYKSTQYINDRILPPNQQTKWINVFLSIESKKESVSQLLYQTS